ncbi:response regulator transcription factor [Actinomadura barringtoniae]|uniref:Response regulator transcription factor n=1 Tax=Actinomadura barringtoniae TaxID=1427535 RepID=A0A939P7B6_9ACTN|nr:LuxR C-terminal-related transcriptional regulator [Actinomadura barringtoniae]MBO2446900.1 response regulator transcription factor [Actinomadura barringtoniae]
MTPRQFEVFQLLGKGMSTRQIAGRMAVTEHTVKAHTAKILEVLGLESRLQAGLAALMYESAWRTTVSATSQNANTERAN